MPSEILNLLLHKAEGRGRIQFRLQMIEKLTSYLNLQWQFDAHTRTSSTDSKGSQRDCERKSFKVPFWKGSDQRHIKLLHKMTFVIIAMKNDLILSDEG